MASLSTHLRRPDDHGRLAFHPECPLCRGERLAGTLSAEAAISRRAQALLAAGVLGLSTASPAVVLAADPEQEQPGVAAPDQQAGSDFEPGGDSTDLQYVAPQTPAAAAPGGDGTDPLTQELTTVVEAPAGDAGDESDSSDQSQPQPATDPAPAPSAAKLTTPKTGKPAPGSPDGAATSPSTATPPSATTPATGTPVGTDAQPSVVPNGAAPSAPPDPQPESLAGAPQPDTVTNWERHAPPKRAAPAPATTVSIAPAPRPAPASTVSVAHAPVTTHAVATAPQAAPAQPAPPSAAQASNRRAAHRGDRSYVVQPGDSLWSIARDALGDAASTARIAREVNRLWELNGEHIGTGDRDLLRVGTRLVLA